MSSPKNEKAVDETALPGESPTSDDSLLSFLSRWARGELERPEDSASRPSALSTRAHLESIGQQTPQLDLVGACDRDEVPVPKGDGHRYDLLGQLGEGGMGEVFLAFDRDLRRHLAMKTVRDGADRSQLWRFLKEAQVLGQLGHPNIVAVYEMGLTESEQPYYTMPLVQGETLYRVLTGLQNEDPAYLRVFSLTRLVQVFLQVALALEYAHVKGVVHRDIKPANIMIGEHGEVLLLDWGVAKLASQTDVDTEAKADITQSGFAVGTPTYMSPEQVSGRAVDARSDVYALGVLLYEILTFAPPFRGQLMEVMTAHLEEPPVPPRERAPERAIPRALESACLRALAKDPEDRQSSARMLHDEIQAWLEATSDRAKRRERATELAERGAAALAQYYAVEKSVAEAERTVAATRRRFRDWQSVSEKAALFEAEDEVTSRRRALADCASDVVMTLSAALGQDPEHDDARRLMAEFYWDRFQRAEVEHDLASRDYFGKLVASFDDGRYRDALRGDGSLILDSDPAGAEVTLHRFEERLLTLRPVEEQRLGATPTGRLDLPMGSYLATLRKPGYRETRCPVWVSRSREVSARVRLYRDDEIGNELVHVPAGAFVAGGDEEVRGFSLPAAEVDIDDFFIAVHPVSVREYLDFLEALASADPEDALRRSPRRSPDGGYYFHEGADGELRPPEDPGRSRWRDDHPVVSISWHDAVAYCRWRSERDGRTYRLPTELEWEKAARGVDGRWYPWGRRFDASLCNVSGSRAEGPAPQPLDAFPSDVSVYGMRGAAGNVRDWTASSLDDEGASRLETMRIVRGGAHNLPAVTTRVANRFWLAPSFVLGYVGFRLLCEPPAAR